MIYKDCGYENSAEFWIEKGYINFCFEESKISIEEAFGMDIYDPNKKDDIVVIYIRNKIEGRGSAINHGITIKASSYNGNEMIPYSVPRTKDGICQKTVKGHENFDRKYGSKIKAFVTHTAPLIVKYWEADIEDLPKIQKEIENKFDRYKNLKRRNRIHN